MSRELIDALQFIVATASERRNLFNIAPDGPGTSVAFVAKQIIERGSVRVRRSHTQGEIAVGSEMCLASGIPLNG